MLAAEWIVFILIWFSFSVLGASSGRRVKRVIDGLPLVSHGDYNTQYMVSVRDTWGCRGKAEELRNCEGVTHCGGSLIHPEFVLTACHCMVYENYRVKNPPPAIDDAIEYNKSAIIDHIRYQISSHDFILFAEGSLTIQGTAEPFCSMSLWMGSVINGWWSPPQRRAVRAFFPHSRCTVRVPKVLKFSATNFNMGVDVGFVRAWKPFVINQDVRLAPISPPEELDAQFQRVVEKSKACLFIGFGRTGTNPEPAPSLFHMFGHMKCDMECTNILKYCLVCSTYLGPKMHSVAPGDSGSPIICEKELFAVASSARYEVGKNFSIHMGVPLSCIQHYLTEEHMSKLITLSDNFYRKLGGQIYGQYSDYEKIINDRLKPKRPIRTFASFQSSSSYQLRALSVFAIVLSVLMKLL